MSTADVRLGDSDILEHLTLGNYGPDGTLEIRWLWVYRVKIRPGQRILYRFSFDAWFENTVLIYTFPNLDKVVERGNYSRSQDDYDFINKDSKEVEHIITAWHKPSPPRASKPWLHSPSLIHRGTPNVDIIGFADDQGRENHIPRNPDLYRNALVSVVYF